CSVRYKHENRHKKSQELFVENFSVLRFAKLTYGITVPGVRIPHSPQIKILQIKKVTTDA
ncbi:hypothetical protein, partial [Alistipes putredinis]|uniref:hypothetical protein n=1 Tax=Alistipes putredinis TaxID=28117 RepID=UPI003AB6FE01